MKNGNFTLIIAVLAALVLGGGLVAMKFGVDKKEQMESDKKAMAMQKEEMKKDTAMKKDDKMMPSVTAMIEDKNAMKKEDSMMMSYKGKVIAGKSSPYLEFNKADYDAALKSGKIVLLDFYANWCPICRAEAPNLQAGFDSLTTDKVVGFRVNWQDDQTDADEKALSSEFKIPTQHTKVILKNGKEVARSSESWDAAMFTSEINKVMVN